MGFDDFFKHGRHGHHYDEHEYKNSHCHSKHHDYEKAMYYLRKLSNNKKILFFVSILTLGVAVLGISALVFIIPFAIDALEFINTEGINGAIESINPFIDRLMNGETK